MAKDNRMVKGAGSMESAVTDRAPLLEVESVRKSFGGLDVLQGISLSVYPGEICGLIGPNGCGKSTLFDVITGYQKADSGVVRFAGKSVEKDLPHEVARNGLIRTFQLTRVFPQLTVAENLLVFADVRDEAGDDRARELLDFVHLLALADREASTLSYGQLKLLELAQVLMHRPKMLLLDEPMAGINPGLIEEIVGYLRQLRDEGMTILLVEHNLPVVTDLCDRIAVISAGEVLVNDAPDIVVNNPVVKEVFLGG